MRDIRQLTVLPCGDDVLRLRRIGAHDEADLFDIYGDPDVMRHASDPVFRDSGQVRQTILSIARNIHTGTALELGVVLKSTEQLIGVCGFHNFGPDTAEIGYLLNRDHWGRGLMRRALTLLIRTYAAPLALSSLTADVDRANRRSAGTLAALGFALLREEGDNRIYHLDLGAWTSDGPRPLVDV